MTRSSSSSTLGRTAPGRVDSPPTSTRSAPSASSCQPVLDRRGRLEAYRPPSENESGVTLTMPITRQRAGLRQAVDGLSGCGEHRRVR